MVRKGREGRAKKKSVLKLTAFGEIIGRPVSVRGKSGKSRLSKAKRKFTILSPATVKRIPRLAITRILFENLYTSLPELWPEGRGIYPLSEVPTFIKMHAEYANEHPESELGSDIDERLKDFREEGAESRAELRDATVKLGVRKSLIKGTTTLKNYQDYIKLRKEHGNRQKAYEGWGGRYERYKEQVKDAPRLPSHEELDVVLALTGEEIRARLLQLLDAAEKVKAGNVDERMRTSDLGRTKIRLAVQGEINKIFRDIGWMGFSFGEMAKNSKRDKIKRRLERASSAFIEAAEYYATHVIAPYPWEDTLRFIEEEKVMKETRKAIGILAKYKIKPVVYDDYQPGGPTLYRIQPRKGILATWDWEKIKRSNLLKFSED
jgi:hypothetical protein